MSDRSKPPFFRRSVAAVAIAAGAVWIGGSAAHSQSSGSGSMLRPSQMERMIEAGGYRLTGPVARHGQIYLADVIGPEDNEERLVFDARDGRLLRHAPGESRQSATPDGRSPVATFFANLFGAQEDVAPLSPPPASDFLETPKPKPAAKRPKSAVQQATVPPDSKAASPAPDATAPAATPPAASAPIATAPASPAPAGGKPPAASPPETAAASPAAPTSKASSQKLNDVPVAPLE
jgi:hypothetical protein